MIRKRRRSSREIAPEEIFLDAASDIGADSPSGTARLERPLSRATYFAVPLVLSLALFALGARAADLQIAQGAALAERSAANSLAETTLFAPRGLITDEHGVPLAENRDGPDGIPGRSYPYPELGTVIGYVSTPKKDSSGNYYDVSETGIAGLEAEFNTELAGQNGDTLVETDAVGQVRSQGVRTPAVPGGTLVLSLDADLEDHFATAIADTARRAGFIAGAGVIMDVHTGAIRAIVSYPSYDPNVMSSGGPAATIASYNKDAGHPFLDHAVAGVYTPGSIVKPFVAAGALADAVITPSTVIDDPGVLTIPDPYHPGQTFRYTGWKALGPVSVREAIAWSSDVFFYTVGGGHDAQKGLGIERLDQWYQAFGLGTTTGSGLPGETSGVIPSPSWKQATFAEPWYLGDTYHTAIGQYGTQVTPIQMARATAALANGGTLVTPSIVEGETSSGSTIPIDPAILEVVREGMREGVTAALAKPLDLPYVSVAAKTGTAQVGSANQYDNSWVEGFFPYANPQYAFAVVLERGPSGAGEEAVNAMADLFASLHSEGSTYAGGAGVAAASSTEHAL